MNWLLIAVLTLFIIFMIRGWIKGLLRLLFSILSIVVLIILMSYATPHMNDFIKNHTGIYSKIETYCTEHIQTRAESEIETSIYAAEGEEISLPDRAVSYLTEKGENALENSGVYESAGSRAADLIVSGAAFFVTLIGALILIKLIDRALGIVNHIPVLGGINRFLGLLGGGFEAFLLISLILLFVALIAGTELGMKAADYINDSQLLSYLYYKNIILKIFSLS